MEYQDKPVPAPPVTLALLERGQERFRIYCTPCHSELGDGHGMIVQRGFPPPPSYHIDRLRQAPVQHFYDVITERPWRDVFVRRSRAAGGSLGDRGLYPRPAAQPERHPGGCAARSAGSAAMTRPASGARGLDGGGRRPDRRRGWLDLAPATFPHAWLAALTAWLGWPLGCMGLLLIHALTGGRWGYAIRPQLVAGMSTLLLLLPAVIPLLIVLPTLYPWARPDAAAHLDNRFYLNLPFFLGRGIVYLIVWLGLGGLILRALRQDSPDARLARIAPAGLILLAITVTYAAIDTTMSLDPHFASSVYGLIAIAEMGLLALSVSVFAAVLGPPLDDGTLRSLGKLLLGLLVLWAYLDFMQLLIVWQSDLPNEAPWYIVRLTGGMGHRRRLGGGVPFRAALLRSAVAAVARLAARQSPASPHC